MSDSRIVDGNLHKILMEIRGLLERGFSRAASRVRYNVTDATSASSLKAFAMWYMQITLLLVCCALVSAGGAQVRAVAAEGVGVATTRAPLRTLDRAAAELAWRSWLQSPESTNQNAPPRRITTKSLFITPLVCPKGQRLDRNGCVQVVTVGKEEHERILLEQLNALFTSAPSGDVVYDYGDDEPGPLQLSIPIGLDPQASPLQGQDPQAQAQDLLPNYVRLDKKEGNKDTDAALEAELELLQLQHANLNANDTTVPDGYGSDILNRNVLSIMDKPKRDSLSVNSSETKHTDIDAGEKEVFFGQVNVDPYFSTEEIEIDTDTETPTTPIIDLPDIKSDVTINNTEAINNNTTILVNISDSLNKTNVTTIINSNNATTIVTDVAENSTTLLVKKESDQYKLSPETDYADIGEAIKLISRYAEVTTDDSFTKDQSKYAMKDDGVLGTRTRMQHRRIKPKQDAVEASSLQTEHIKKNAIHAHPDSKEFYRYPWQYQHSQTPPSDYPFRHIQDYWKGRSKIGGLYNVPHDNPRRHHHAISDNYFRPHGLSYGQNIENVNRLQFLPYPHQGLPKLPRHVGLRPRSDDSNLYTLLGLKHWFSSEGISNR